MDYLEKYIETLKFKETKQTVRNVTSELFEKCLSDFVKIVEIC